MREHPEESALSLPRGSVHTQPLGFFCLQARDVAFLKASTLENLYLSLLFSAPSRCKSSPSLCWFYDPGRGFLEDLGAPCDTGPAKETVPLPACLWGTRSLMPVTASRCRCPVTATDSLPTLLLCQPRSPARKHPHVHPRREGSHQSPPSSAVSEAYLARFTLSR